MIDKAALDRIIAAVGKEPNDRELLSYDIQFAYQEYLILVSWKRTRSAKTARLVERIRKNLQKDARLIESDETIKRATRDHSLVPLIKVLGELEAWQAQPRLRAEGYRQTISAFEELAGVYLFLAYKARFGPPGGEPRIRFIDATLTELKIDHARDSIVTAINRCTELRKSIPFEWEEMPSMTDADMPETVRKALQDKS
jgi:hypothetical protein